MASLIGLLFRCEPDSKQQLHSIQVSSSRRAAIYRDSNFFKNVSVDKFMGVMDTCFETDIDQFDRSAPFDAAKLNLQPLDHIPDAESIVHSMFLFEKWEDRPFCTLPDELVHLCLSLTITYEESRLGHRTLSGFVRLQGIRQTCRRFSRIGLDIQCSILGSDITDWTLGPSGCRLIIQWNQAEVKRFDIAMYPRMVTAHLQKLCVDEQNIRPGSWSTIIDVLSHATRLNFLRIEADPPRIPKRKRKLLDAIGALSRLRRLNIFAPIASSPRLRPRWCLEDLLYLIKRAQAGWNPDILALDGWDFEEQIPLDISGQQSHNIGKLVLHSCRGARVSTLNQLLESIFSQDGTGFGFSTFNEGTEYDSIISSVIRKRSQSLQFLSVEVRPMYRLQKEPQMYRFSNHLDDAVTACNSLSVLGLDGGHEWSGLLSPNFLDTLDCPNLVQLALMGCYIDLSSLFSFLSKQTRRGNQKLVIEFHAFFGDYHDLFLTMHRNVCQIVGMEENAPESQFCLNPICVGEELALESQYFDVYLLEGDLPVRRTPFYSDK
ncbi:hypothetical protein BT69DRAFT_1318223 [Atractiella rhizophila]|nr:hypothetical protein BT69DRAFT_1318223 [Atractiella rhizophila]